jgi:dihydropteroate synthase
MKALDRHKEVARFYGTRVVCDASDLDIAIAFEAGIRHPADEFMKLHCVEDNRHVIAEIGGRRFEWGARTYVMGIVNVTPDSFSGDGVGTDHDAAVEQGLRMVQEGAAMLDVGGESTRPGHAPVTASEEIARTEEVIGRLAREAGVPVSIDTYKVEVAEAAVAAGATILNDVWGLTRSPSMAGLAAKAGCGLVVMHNQDGTHYAVDLMEEIKRFLRESVRRAMDAGVLKERVIIDPGIGFGKTADQNWEVLRRLGELRELDQPVLLGTSRKSFIGKLLDLPVDERVEGTTATVVAGVLRGADIVRVHDVLEMTRAVRVADRLR